MFEDYACIPLDVPLPPVNGDEMRRFVQTHCERCAFTDDEIRWVGFFARKPKIGSSLQLYTHGVEFEDVSKTLEYGWDPAFAERFPDLLDWFENLPFARLTGLTLTTQTDHVPDHMDIFGNNNSVSYYEAFRSLEPRYYRMIFSREVDEISRRESFYVTEEFGGPRRYVELPDETAIFAVSSSACYHGAKHNPGSYKTTGVLYGELDMDGHLELLRRSLVRFGGSCIRLTRPGPVLGPGAERPYRGVG